VARSLEQWLDYQGQVHHQAIVLGLDRLHLVLDALGWKQSNVPVITVAGTNGKGSVSAYCTAILSAAGYRVGTFTSPHLREYRERIRIHDRFAAADELVNAFDRIEAARGEVKLTFFEYNTLAALLLFDAAKLDAWVLEIGMGGRLDAVNIVEPDATVVVSIGLDHQQYLGDSLEAIAREKAGIFRRGKAAVIGGREPMPVLESVALQIGAPLKRLAIEYNYVRDGAGWRYRGSEWNLPPLPPPALAGDIQFANAAAALATLEALDARLPVSAEAIAKGLQSVSLPGRFQVVAGSATTPGWILDVAHNADAARILARNLSAAKGQGRTLAVCGILADKDVATITSALDTHVDAWWCASIEGTRGQDGTALAAEVRKHVSSPVSVADSVAAACAAAYASASAADRILVFGSFHTVGPGFDYLEAQGFLS
jgi:dihydrofolate synthase / folylpolyglutamate synthase